MPLSKPATHFLLLGSLLLAAFLTLWWLALRSPMLSLLRVSAEVPLRLLAGPSASLTVDPSGDWAFRLPVADAKFRSIDFTVPRSDLMVFTFGLPVYWALALAATPRGFGALIKGSALLASVEILSLLGFVKCEAWSVMAQLHSSSSALAQWSLELGNYLTANVIPDTAPFLIAVSLHRQLRSQIFPSGPSPAASSDSSAPLKIRRRQQRGLPNPDGRRNRR